MTNHIYVRHMPGAPKDCSIFKSRYLKKVNDIVNLTVKYSDRVNAHRSDINRTVYMKKKIKK